MILNGILKSIKTQGSIYAMIQRDIFLEVDSLTELIDYNEIYLDSLLFPNM